MKSFISLFLLSAAVFTLNAQVFVENFDKATVGEDLEGYNGWEVSPIAAEATGLSPKISAGPLTYEGYPGSNIGNVAVLAADAEIVRSSIKNTGLTTPEAGGTIYAAFLVNVSTVAANAYRDIFSFDQSVKSQWLRGRVLARYNAKTNKVMFAVTKNSNTGAIIEAGSTNTLSLSLDGGVSHLLILKYEAVEGEKNDVITLYVNPDLSKNEFKQANKLVAADNAEVGDYKSGSDVKIGIRQRGAGAQLGFIRVGTSWKDVVTESRSKQKK